MAHPAGPTVRLGILPSPPDCRIPALIGIEIFPFQAEIEGAESGFVVTSSSGNMQRTETGHLTGEQLLCAYPRLTELPARSLNRPPVGGEEPQNAFGQRDV
jgi:hypothetical protein